MIENQKKRILWVDVIRAISFMLIICSHVLGKDNPGLQLLFGFNVPCMVIVSGYMAGKDKSNNAISYYKKRILRIVFPSWFFFSVYFILIKILTLKQSYPYDFKQIVTTFAFMDGIGYTWILAIFVMIAIIVPVIWYLDLKIKYFPQIVLVCYGIIGSAIFVFNSNSRIAKLVLYVLTYVFLSCIGIFLDRYIKSKTSMMVGCSLFVFLIIFVLVTNRFSWYDFHLNKYPPSIYYALYGVLIFALIYFIFSHMNTNENNPIMKSIIYISKNSFDIYLWHIFALYLTQDFDDLIIRLIAVGVISLGLSYLYRKIINSSKQLMNKRRSKV